MAANDWMRFRGWFEGNFRSIEFFTPETMAEWKAWVEHPGVRMDVLFAACRNLIAKYTEARIADPMKRFEPPSLVMLRKLYYDHDRNVRRTEHRECSHCGGYGWLYCVIDRDKRTIQVSSPFDYDQDSPRIVLRPCGCSAGQEADPAAPYEWRQRNMMCGVNPEADNRADAVNGRMYLEKLFRENVRTAQPTGRAAGERRA